MKKFAIFDFDLTLSEGFSGVEFLKYLHKMGVCPDNLYNRNLKAIRQYKSQKLCYEELVKELGRISVAVFKGRKRKDISEFAVQFFKEFKNNIYKESYALVRELKDRDYYIVVISSSPHEIIVLASKSLGIDMVYALKVEVKNGIYAGRLKVPLNDPKYKEKLMSKLSRKYNLSESFGFGDSISDLGILKHVGIPVALNASKELGKFAKANGWLVLNRNNVVKEVKNYITSRNKTYRNV